MKIEKYALIIVGNSAAARETYDLFHDNMAVLPAGQQRAFKGFLSHRKYVGDLGSLKCFFLGSDEEYVVQENDRFIIAIADPGIRRDAQEMLEEKGAVFCNLISRRSFVAPEVTMGQGNLIGMGCTISRGVSMGRGNFLNGGCRVGHDASIGDFNFIGPETLLLGSCAMGDSNRLGARSTQLEKSVIGNNNVIAPSSVVFKGCGNNKRMAGNPALPL